jgi:hypothetical protein
MTPKILRILRCHSHGDRKWQGHVMCDTCGWVYQTSDSRKHRYAPQVCEGKREAPFGSGNFVRCGAPLMPIAPVGDRLGLVGNAVFGVDPSAPPVNLGSYADADFTARPICYLCFRQVDRHHYGVVPNWKPTRREPLRGEGN